MAARGQAKLDSTAAGRALYYGGAIGRRGCQATLLYVSSRCLMTVYMADYLVQEDPGIAKLAFVLWGVTSNCYVGRGREREGREEGMRKGGRGKEGGGGRVG